MTVLLGGSAAMRALKAQIRKVAHLQVPVLLMGESGTGKELVARALHQLSGRQDRPYVVVNAAAVPAGLVESEFFGHEAGAFTGADRRGRRGKFEMAHGGTLFLDEIGDMAAETQVKFLRVLEDGHYERLGGHQLSRADFRLICASHRDLAHLQETGQFRHDLYYRISTVTLKLPPLRDRREDIPELVNTFLARFARRHGTRWLPVEPRAMAHLQSLSWPGNVRQLMHAVERAAIFTEGEAIDLQDLPAMQPGCIHGRTQDDTVRSKVGQVEAEMIHTAMQRFGGNKKRVAEALGISRSYLYKRLADVAPDESLRLISPLN